MSIFKIKFSFLFWVTSFLTVITGTFREYVFFMSLILIHEMGHALVAMLFHWKIKEIHIYPFGGVTLFEEKINRPMLEELCILLAGPMIQILYHGVLKTSCSLPIFSFYHHMLLFFNLLPIYPLDGGRLFFLFYQSFFPYLKSHKFMIMTSVFSLLFCLLLFSHYHFSYFLILYFFFLFLKIIEEKRKEPFLFKKFLLERFLYSFSFPFYKKIEGLNVKKMYRVCNHFFHIQKKMVCERDILTKMFDL